MNQSCEITLEIGGMPILLHLQDASFRQLLALRYAGFVDSPSPPKFEFDIELTAPLARRSGRRRSGTNAGRHVAAAARRFSRPLGSRVPAAGTFASPPTLTPSIPSCALCTP